jgi:hypothetical protein
MNSLPFHDSSVSPNRQPLLLPFCGPSDPPATPKSPLTDPTFVVQYASGKPASRDGVRQLAAAFPPFAQFSIKPPRSRSLCGINRLRDTHFVSPLISYSSSNRGVGVPTLRLPTVCPPRLRSIPYPLSLQYFAHSFALFCKSVKLNFFPFMRFRTLSQKQGGCGGRNASRISQWIATRALSAPGRSNLPKVQFFGGDLTCV